uniref:Uncharacterized protein n=1 Tax=Meloidogyne enterolobii TaxID=390850 RepID=A0A6V7X869_MELEN|nr:unnamed protein product [Meloidogyne enterolobii]
MADAIKAPELLNNPHNPSDKADVCSFGLMAFGLFHNENYIERSQEAVIVMLRRYREDRNNNERLDHLIKVK